MRRFNAAGSNRQLIACGAVRWMLRAAAPSASTTTAATIGTTSTIATIGTLATIASTIGAISVSIAAGPAFSANGGAGSAVFLMAHCVSLKLGFADQPSAEQAGR